MQADAPRLAATEIKSRQDTVLRGEADATVTAAASAIPDGSSNTQTGELAREFPAQNTTPLQAAEKVQPAPQPSASEALRASEPAALDSPAQPSAPAQRISVRIAPPQGSSVDIQMMERGGQVQVAVRTADGGLEISLRQDLGTLVNSLERSGFRTEAFTPREAFQQTAAAAQTTSPNGQDSPPGSGGRGGNFGSTSQNSSQGNSSEENPGGGGQQQQPSRDQHSPEWIEELENLK